MFLASHRSVSVISDCPAVRNIHRILSENLWKVIEVSLEMSSDPKNYFGLTFDEVTDLDLSLHTC